MSINSRVSKSIILEIKPIAGLITQMLLFEGNESRYRIVYCGGVVGINYGKRNKFLETTIGSAYFYSETDSWGSSTNRFSPIVTLGYKKNRAKTTFRT